VLPPGDDPDSFTRKNGGEAFREKIETAPPLLDYVMEKIIQKNDIATPRGKVMACDEIVPLLAMIADTMERDLYIQKTSQRLGVPEAQLRSRNAAGPHQLSPSDVQQQPAESSLDFRKNAEAIILKLMIIHPETIALIDRDSLLDEFIAPELKTIGMALITNYRQQGAVNLGAVTELLAEAPLQKLLAHLAFQQDVAGPAPQKILEDCIRSIRLSKISRERQRITRLLKQAEAARDESSATEFQKQYLQLVEEQKKISRFRLDFLQG
jgi:DNA primase